MILGLKVTEVRKFHPFSNKFKNHKNKGNMMLKREITYEDFNGEEVTEVFYFNISKPELIEMEVEYEQGFGVMIEKVIKSKDNKTLIKVFKDIVLLAYGKKSEDGKRFIKSEELRLEFSQTAAFSVLFMELAVNDNAAAIFLKGVLPKDMVEEINKAMLSSPPTTVNPTPSA